MFNVLLPGTEISVHAEFSHCRQKWYYELLGMCSTMALKCGGPCTFGPPHCQIHRNTEVASLTGLCPVLDLITRRRNVVFGHIARLSEDTPAHQSLRCHVDLSLGHLPDQGWRRRPGRPSNRWIDQVPRDNNNIPPADLWRRSIVRGHSGVTLRSLPTTR